MALRRLAALALLVASLALVPALGVGAAHAANSGTTPTPTSTPTIAFATNPTVTVAVPYLPSELNPWAPSGANPVTAMILEQVLPQASVVDNHLTPTICFMDVTDCPEDLFTRAEEVSVSPETIVYSIDPRARWSDGVQITAADFIYLWQQVRARAGQLPSVYPIEGYEDIASIRASSSGKTVTVVFARPYADWPALFTYLVPSHIGQSSGFVAAFSGFDPARDLSGGPYRISRYVPGHALVLVRNPKFWGSPPPVARIIFRVQSSEGATLKGLAAGRISLAVMTPGPAVDATVASSTALIEQQAPSPVLWQLDFNLADPALASVTVREAIAKAVDRHQLVADTVGLLTPFGTTAGNRLFFGNAPGSVGNDATYAVPNAAETDSLLVGDGDSVDANGLVTTTDATPLVLQLVAPAGNPVIGGVVAQLQAELLQAGITLEISNVSENALLSTILPSGGYELALAPYDLSPYPSTNELLYSEPVGPAPPPPPSTTTGSTPPRSTPATSPSGASSSSTVAVPSGPSGLEPASAGAGAVTRDVTGFADPTVTSLFNEATAELNATAAVGLYNEIDTVLWQELPTLPLFQMPVVVVARSGVQNVTDSQTWAGVMWNAENWTVELNPPSTAPTTTTTTAP